MISRRELFKAAAVSGIAACAGPSIAKALPRRIESSLLLGKLPPVPDKPKLRLADYVKISDLPPVPEEFGHESLVKSWGMLGNGFDPPNNPAYAPNGVGDCAIAGPYHSLQLWSSEAGRAFNVTTERVLETYGEVTYYDPKKYDPFTGGNPTDQGTNVQDMAEYWRNSGFADCDGRIHKIDAYLALEPGDIDQLWQAMYLFDGVGIGIQCPKAWQAAFQNHQVWDAIAEVNPGDIAGGHYVTGVSRRGGNIGLVTWGQVQMMTPAGYSQFCDEAFVYYSEDRFNAKGVDINGFDKAQLMDDMMELARSIY
jgi:hypothetical protein